MRDDKPLISILMAVYHPRMDWLVEQLDSLNQQTYPNLELIVCDDGPDEPVDESVFAEQIKAFPWTLVRNEQNLGSNKTFERLTGMANGKYIAYCDQDDVWLPQKMMVLMNTLHRSKALLVCSDVTVIGESGRSIANSITEVRRRHVFKGGDGLAPSLLFRNFVMGCTMLVQTETAKEAIPFVEHMVHDHWIALWASIHGRVAVVNEPLIQYRIHSGNQTNVLACVYSKEDYIRQRVLLYTERMQELNKRIDLGEVQRVAEAWGKARWEFSNHISGAARKMWRLRKLNISTTVFELTMLRMPTPLFLRAVRMIQRGEI